MFRSLTLLSLLITPIYVQNDPCSPLNNKLAKHDLHLPASTKNAPALRVCSSLGNDSCCPHSYEEQLQNVTATELYQLFELHSVRLYEPLVRAAAAWNETISRLIESSRNTAHLLFRGDDQLLFRSSVDLFFNNILTSTHKSQPYDVRNYVDELFRQLLRASIEFTHVNQSRIPSYFACLWRNQPFADRPNVIGNQLEVHLAKLSHLNEVLQLSIEFVRLTSTSVTTDTQCIDSFMQLSYCNLCAGRTELPCLSSCIDAVEGCLVNVSLINDVWSKLIGSLETTDYFDGVESVLSSLGASIVDAVMTFLSADGSAYQKIVQQCGPVPMRKVSFRRDQKLLAKHRNSISLLDYQLVVMRQSLKPYKSFWSALPEQICRSNDIASVNGDLCWTGTALSQDQRRSSRPSYDKPLSLRLQWLLKELSNKTQPLGKLQQVFTDNISTTTNKPTNSSTALALPNVLDDYQSDDELHYSDYAYEDSPDESTSTSTTRASSTTALDDNLLLDEVNTVSYYEYGEQDVYIDDQTDESSTRRSSSLASTTTTPNTVPWHHRRQPVMWNINRESTSPFSAVYNSSRSDNHSGLFAVALLLLLLLLRLLLHA